MGQNKMADSSDKRIQTIDQQLAAASNLEDIERLVRVRGELLLQEKPTQQLDKRIAEANDRMDMILLARIRGELIRQDEEVRVQEHRRALDRIELIGRQLLSCAALGVGTWLIPHGHWSAGLFVLGAALYNLAPRYVLTALKNVQGAKEDEE